MIKINSGSENKLLKLCSFTKQSTQTEGHPYTSRAEGIPSALPAMGKFLPVGPADLCRQGAPRQPARLLSGGFIVSLKLLRCQKEKPLGGG